jgi:hypothetical protein
MVGPEHRRDESGIALIITVMLLLMISLIGISALRRAGDESAMSISSKRKVKLVHAADAALNIVADQLLSSTTGSPDTTPLDQPALFTENGFATAARTGTVDSAVPQPILRVGRTTTGGSQLNVNAANTFSYGVYRVGVVATDSAGGRAQIQAQFTVPEGSSSYK